MLRRRFVPLAVLVALLGACYPSLDPGQAVRRLPAARTGVVSLTFDDGPDPRWTPGILDLLEEFGATASFFMIGMHAERHPELVAEVARRGHRVEGHTWSHTALPRMGDAAFAADVDRANEHLGRLAGSPVRCVRPPMGIIDAVSLERLGRRGMAAALWSHDTRDWQRPGAQAIVNRALAGLTEGSVVLFHDGGGDRSQTVTALRAVLAEITRRGLRVEPMC